MDYCKTLIKHTQAQCLIHSKCSESTWVTFLEQWMNLPVLQKARPQQPKGWKTKPPPWALARGWLGHRSTTGARQGAAEHVHGLSAAPARGAGAGLSRRPRPLICEHRRRQAACEATCMKKTGNSRPGKTACRYTDAGRSRWCPGHSRSGASLAPSLWARGDYCLQMKMSLTKYCAPTLNTAAS